MWQLLFEADRLMARMDAQRLRAPVSVGAAPQAPAPSFGAPPPPSAVPPPPGFTPYPGASMPVREPRRTVSVGSVLLALGAGCLVVAAVVFVAVTWGSLSLATRTMVLLGVTALAFAVTGLLTVRRLHGSVEALSAVAWMFLAIDLAGARASGLLNLDRLDGAVFVVVAGLVAALPASLVVWETRRRVDREPIVSSLVTIGGWLLVMLGLSEVWTGRPAWLLIIVVLLAAALAVVYQALQLQWLTWTLAGLAAALHGSLLLVAAATSTLDDHRGLVADGRIWPVLVTIGLTVLAAEVLRRHRATRQHGTTIVALAAVAVSLLIGLLVVAPAWHSGPGWGTAALCVVALTLTVLGRAAAWSWATGPRVVAPIALLTCVLVATPWPLAEAGGLVERLVEPWQFTADVRLTPLGVGELLPLSTAVACLATLAVGALLLSLWEQPILSRRAAAVAATALVWMALGLVAVAETSRVWVAVVVVAVPGLALVAVGVWRRLDAAAAAGAVALTAACGLAVPSVGLSLVVWATTLAAFAGLLLRDPRARAAGLWAAACVVLSVGCTAATVELTGGTEAAQSLALSILLAAVLVATIVVPPLALRLAVLLAVVCAAPLPVLLAIDLGPARTALSLTVIGAAAALVGVLDRSRRVVGLGGAGLLLVAWWLRLVASDIGVVEAYTGLPAAILVAAGLWAVLRRSTPTLVALLPGLVLAVAPSLPWAMADPTSPRGLLVSAAGLALLGAGAALRWLAPFLVGAGVVTAMSLVHLVPFADALPRWVVLTAVGLALLGVGITWEHRVRNLRSAAVWVTAMR